jgi:hypothetical protein
VIRIYIPSDISLPVDKKELFILIRPFYMESNWGNHAALVKRWELDDSKYRYTSTIEDANVMLIPFPVNEYVVWGHQNVLKRYQQQCEAKGIKGYAFVSGDWGRAYPEYNNLLYFRASGFRSQLSTRNVGFPVLVHDAYKLVYNETHIDIREKRDLPVIGFCGHASFSVAKRIMESVQLIRENIKRFLMNPFRKDWEPVFASAYERAKMLSRLTSSSKLQTHFIYRNRYRAGALTQEEREKTNREYFDNIRESDYILCMRGGGNFSVRFYETLMMGRIPVFVNTDCLMPFEDTINWKEHVVWIDWKDRNEIDSILSTYHQNISADEFRNKQMQNRTLWRDTLSLKGMLEWLDVKNESKKSQ